MPVPKDDSTTLSQRQLRLSDPPVGAFRLHVTDGIDTGVSVRLDGSEAFRVLVGTSPACDFRLNDPAVSRRHMAVEVSGDVLRLTDLKSTNGTTVNGLTVLDAHLRGNEAIQIGSTTIRVLREDTPERIALSRRPGFGKLVGASIEMRRLYPLCERLAAKEVPVILEGETGTGKELLAESLHEEGPLKDGPFVVFDCTAVAASLLESELFGHERGAFTGAHSTRKGIFEQADGGTLLIDEIGDLDLAMQPKLLRALERGEIRRVGGDHPIKVRVRVLAATRRDLEREIQAGRFRDDLFHRLAVARIELPPLRSRTGDIPILVDSIARALEADEPIPAGVVARWQEYDWPGNVRELRNAVARYVALGDPSLDSMREASRPSRPSRPSSSVSSGAGPDDVMSRVLRLDLPLARARQILVDEFERRYIERVLEAHGGNVSRAARASGVARRYFQVIKARAR